MMKSIFQKCVQLTKIVLAVLVFSQLAFPFALGFESLVAQSINDPSAGDPPNILICIADDWSYGHASSYGCDWIKTPAFDRIARQGVLFHRAYTPNAKCAPSRACLLTGRNSWQLKDACNHVCYFPTEFKSFMEALNENGYATGHTAKGWGPGIATDEEGRPRALTGLAFNGQKTSERLAGGISRIDYAANFNLFLESVESDQPWCFWFGALEPHRGYEYGSGARLDGKKTAMIDRVPGFWPDNDNVRNDMLDYAHEVEHFDSHVSQMIDSLERNGQLDNTIIIMTSDHGMPFPRCKGQAYEMSNHVPLAIFWGTGIRHGDRVIDDYVSLIDIAPTLLECANIDWGESGMSDTPGRTLSKILGSDQSGQIEADRDHVLIGKERHDIGRPDDAGYPIRGIIRNNHLMLQNFRIERWPAGDPITGYLNCDGGPTKTLILDARREQGSSVHWDFCFGKREMYELYDLNSDPDCLNNLAKSEDHDALKMELLNEMNARLKAQGDPRLLGVDPDQFDRVEYADDSTRDFYNRKMKGEDIRAGWVDVKDAESELLDKPDGKGLSNE